MKNRINKFEKNFKKLYDQHIEDNSPDMDSIWEKIESGLEPKQSDGVTSKPVRKNIRLRNLTVWGTVCAAALVIIPVSIGVLNNNFASNDLASGSSSAYLKTEDKNDFFDGGMLTGDAGNSGGYDMGSADEMYDAAGNASPESANSGESSGGFAKRMVFYDEIFPYDGEIFTPSAETSGDDFFVEEKVLVETDIIVNAYIDKVYSKGNTICYEITAENAEISKVESFVLESATPYVMQQGGSYILPLKIENGEYRLVFENAPQIQVSESGGMVFHNGWKTLDALEENPIDVVYPQNGIDDFFYDRMRFTYSSDISILVEEWRQVKFGVTEENFENP